CIGWATRCCHEGLSTLRHPLFPLKGLISRCGVSTRCNLCNQIKTTFFYSIKYPAERSLVLAGNGRGNHCSHLFVAILYIPDDLKEVGFFHDSSIRASLLAETAKHTFI